MGVSLLPLRCRQPGHSLLTETQGFPAIGGLELALYARPGLGRAGRSLRDQLRDMCGG
ncbi:hypothetical protein D3C85_1880150 [compost metagenome]